MRFGPIPLSEAEGAIAAHSVRLAKGAIRKGTILTGEHIEELAAEGHEAVVAVLLEPGDVDENAAASSIAVAIAGTHISADEAFTGRANLHAEAAGVLTVDRDLVDAVNRIDPGITLATLPDFAAVEADRMVATVKIIPFSVREAVVDEAVRTITDAGRPVLAVAPYKPKSVALIATTLPGLKASVMDKTRRILETRLRPAGARLAGEQRIAHDGAAVAAAIKQAAKDCDIVVVFGASAITDHDDVIPAAIERAGGTVRHFGMPVDPGNLLLLGDLGAKPVIGAPGCARSPKENGFDWVLSRLLADLPVSAETLTGMGVGGLLMEIVSRPQPRQPAMDKEGPVAAIILAAGQSRRMGAANKLLATFDGEPLVRRTVMAATASKADPVIVVTGHMADRVAAALTGLNIEIAHNPDFAEGLATSLRAGLAAVPADAAGALVMLADMPGVFGGVIDKLIAAFSPGQGRSIVLPTAAGKRGNPVLWSRAYFPELMALTGDTGARHLLAEHDDAVTSVEIGAAVAVDVDTPEALKAAGGEPADDD
ncbi:MAG TPA: molybdopterin-binding/glycosyltransferase family 2 protein [Afifellaceae bacterium]|nr:molybdopterin-binding/glycosyltransferase family 2 protein [Afifellaceae bacterium]